MLHQEKTVTMGLVAGRHEMPCTEYIWDSAVENPMDLDALFATVCGKIPKGTDILRLYVTGLTPCLLAVVDYCARAGITLVALQYDRETNTYKEHVVLLYKHCPICGGRIPDMWGRHTVHQYCPECGST